MMAYVSGKKMIQHAWDNNYAIGAFSAHNAETICAILEAAQEEKSPIMIQIGQKVINTLGLQQMKDMVDSFMVNYSIPICVHLDHSRCFNQVVHAIRAGFHSVMFDGSHLTFAENVEITRKVVEIAHALDMGSEGEIGKIGGTEDDISVDEKEAFITSTEEALLFSQQTQVDYLAVSIGTAHGMYKQEPKLAFERLAEIRDMVKKPIVLHGGSGVPDEQILKAISLGVAKINVDTELRQAFTQGILDILADNPHEYTLATSLGRGREFMKRRVKEKIRLFGSHNKAACF